MSFPIDVIFAHPDAGYQGDQDHARRCGLVPGQVYQLRSMQVSQSDTYLELHGYKHERFSSVLFEPWDMSAWFLLAEMKAGAYLAGSQPHPVSTITEPELAAALASVSPGRPVTPAEEARLLVQHAEDTQDRYRYRYRRTETDDILRAIEKVDAHLDNAAPSVYRTSPAASAELNEARAVANKWRRIAGGPGCEVHEATEALLAVTGGNPRKGVHGSEEDVLSELGDTVVAGLLAIQSQTKDIKRTWAVFLAALAKADARVTAFQAGPGGPVTLHTHSHSCGHEPEGREMALSDPELI